MRKRKTYSSKNIKEIYDYHFRKTIIKGKGRAKKQNVTKEEVARYNDRKAEAELRLTLDNNFKANDYYITTTFKEDVGIETAYELYRKFTRKLRDLYRKKKVPKPKYIYVCEGKRRIHFHMILGKEFDISVEEFESIWPHGYIEVVAYHGKAEDAIKLASYFLKEKRAVFYREKEGEDAKKFKKRWVTSRGNLELPKEETKTLKYSEWRDDIKAPKGYCLDKESVIEGVNPAGYQYRFYRLIKLDPIQEVYKKGKTRVKRNE